MPSYPVIVFGSRDNARTALEGGGYSVLGGIVTDPADFIDTPVGSFDPDGNFSIDPHYPEPGKVYDRVSALANEACS